MVRLTPELISRAPQYMNPLREREISLRGLSLPALEHLGATRDSFDSLDASDNLITDLGSEDYPLPRLARLRTVLLCNNRISSIGSNIGDSFPFVSTLVLTNNAMASLRQIWQLRSLSSLNLLSLLGNPVVLHPQYRLFTVWCLPQLRQLDFRKVKAEEREAAKEMYGKPGGMSAAAEATMRAQEEKDEIPNGHLMSFGGTTVQKEQQQTGEVAAAPAVVASSAEITAIQEAIRNAKSLDEIKRLQAQLEATGGTLAP